MINIASTGTYSASSGETTAPIPKPTGLAVGDLMVAVISAVGSELTIFPSGWSQVGKNDLTYNKVTVFKKIATQDDVNASTFIWGGSHPVGGIIYRISDGRFNSIQMSTGALTPSADNNAIILVGMGSDDDSDITRFSGYRVTGGATPSFTENYDEYIYYNVYTASLGVASAIYQSSSQVTGFGVTAQSSQDETSRFMVIIAGGSKPTVTTQAVSDILPTTATGNGNITDTGGVNPHLRGIAYMPASSGDINSIPISNPSFENTLPFGWVNWGTGSVELSTSQVKYGTYSLKQNWVSGSDACYQFHPENPTNYRNKKVTFGCWVWSSTPTDGAYVSIFDYADPNWDAAYAYHPGDSTWRFLTVTKTIRGTITDFMLRIGMTRNSAGSTYFDGVVAFYSDSVYPSIAFDSGNYSTGAFTKGLTDLTPNTDYRAVAFAQNSVGVGNGSTVGFTTLKAGDGNFFQLF